MQSTEQAPRELQLLGNGQLPLLPPFSKCPAFTYRRRIPFTESTTRQAHTARVAARAVTCQRQIHRRTLGSRMYGLVLQKETCALLHISMGHLSEICMPPSIHAWSGLRVLQEHVLAIVK